MEVSQERFELALKNLKSSDWARFERLASTFLASDWPSIRTMAAPDGDGGRDSELFSPDGIANVVIQYSVQEKWAEKIRDTAKRLKETFPESTILIFVSNQQIGAKSDSLKKEFLKKGVYLDVRDKSWFVERCNSDHNRSSAASELARVIVDPLLEIAGVKSQASSALTGQDARTALLFLEMHWRDESTSKGLTKSSFEALIRSVLQETTNQSKITRQEVHARVGRILPQHSFDQLAPYIDAALRRLSKTAIRHWKKEDEFNLSHEEIERLKDRKASIALLIEAFDSDVLDILNSVCKLSDPQIADVTELVHRIIENYFLRLGEEFAGSLARDIEITVDDETLKLVVEELAPSKKFISDRNNVQFLLHIIGTLMTSPADGTKEYLRLLADSYTLFAFLEEVPDVQKVTKNSSITARYG